MILSENRCPLFGIMRYQFSLKPAEMLLLVTGWPISLTAVVTCSGPYSFCSALNLLWVTGSELVEARPAASVVPVGSTSNLASFSLPQICGVGCVAGTVGIVRSGRSDGPAGDV